MSDQKPSPLAAWYESELGQQIASLSASHIQARLGKCYGYHSLQLGLPAQRAWLQAVPIAHRIFLNHDAYQQPGVLALPDELPFPENSIDCIVMPHTLEWTADPVRLMREVHRVLMPQGHVVLIGFNPISFWGLRKCFKPIQIQQDWMGKLYTPLGARRLFEDNGLALEKVDSYFYRPPVAHPFIQKKLLFLESLGRLAWPVPGGVYLCVARKHTVKLTRIKPIWRFKRFVVGKQISLPAMHPPKSFGFHQHHDVCIPACQHPNDDH